MGKTIFKIYFSKIFSIKKFYLFKLRKRFHDIMWLPKNKIGIVIIKSANFNILFKRDPPNVYIGSERRLKFPAL